jgi:hypothetical protein
MGSTSDDSRSSEAFDQRNQQYRETQQPLNLSPEDRELRQSKHTRPVIIQDDQLLNHHSRESGLSHSAKPEKPPLDPGAQDMNLSPGEDTPDDFIRDPRVRINKRDPVCDDSLNHWPANAETTNPHTTPEFPVRKREQAVTGDASLLHSPPMNERGHGGPMESALDVPEPGLTSGQSPSPKEFRFSSAGQPEAGSTETIVPVKVRGKTTMVAGSEGIDPESLPSFLIDKALSGKERREDKSQTSTEPPKSKSPNEKRHLCFDEENQSSTMEDSRIWDKMGNQSMEGYSLVDRIDSLRQSPRTTETHRSDAEEEDLGPLVSFASTRSESAQPEGIVSLTNFDRASGDAHEEKEERLKPHEEEEEEIVEAIAQNGDIPNSIPQIDTARGTMSSNALSPHLTIGNTGLDELVPMASRESTKNEVLSTNPFSSSRRHFEFEQIPGRRSASRGSRESEFSGPHPKQIEIDHGDSQYRDFECSPDRTVPKRTSSKGLLPGQDGTAFDASKGESLFTASDLPIFDDPPVLGAPLSSEVDERVKKKVVVFDPKVIQSQKRMTETRPRNKCRVFLAMESTIARAFSIWKFQFRDRVRADQPVPTHPRQPFQLPSTSAVHEPESLTRSRAAERRLKDLAEKHGLISQIERQKDINRSLHIRMEQIRKETEITRQCSPMVGTFHFHSRFGL